MSQPSGRGSRMRDLSEATPAEIAAYIAARCYICGRPDAESTMVLGGATVSGGTQVPRCGNGVGCRDGRIYHGPQGAPHWPSEACEVCERSGEPEVRKQARNAARQPPPAHNSSPRHF